MLNARKKRFCDEYLACLNQTEAARKAGYKSKRPNGLTEQGSRLMKDPEIKKYIANNIKEKKEIMIATQDDLLKYLSGCILGIEKVKTTHVLRGGTKAEYQDELIEREADLQPRDRIKASEIMAKIYNMMDKVEKAPQTVNIINDIPRNNGGVSNE